MSIIISIVTVVYKDLEGLKKTVKNILCLQSPKFEHIIIDGGSGHETVKYLEQCSSTYKNKKIDFKWLSEPDEGIYDAMNKGIALANGTWLNFMNAGDIYTKKTVINEVFPYLQNGKALVYGNKIQGAKIVKPLSIKHLEVGIIMACHQSMFFNKKKMGNSLIYNIQYKIYADYDLVNRIYKTNPLLITYINLEVSIFQGGGISESVSYQKRKDKLKIVFKAYGVFGLFRTYIFKYFPNLINI